MLQTEVRLKCQHAFVEHLRGRLLHAKLAFAGGAGGRSRTIGHGALPLAAVLPPHPGPAWPARPPSSNFPFVVHMYHGCAITQEALCTCAKCTL